MSNKIKPFYIRITGDMTPEMVGNAIDRMVLAGVNPIEQVKDGLFVSKYKYRSSYRIKNWNYFGVDYNNGTLIGDHVECFGEDAIEITFEQLEDHLKSCQNDAQEAHTEEMPSEEYTCLPEQESLSESDTDVVDYSYILGKCESLGVHIYFSQHGCTIDHYDISYKAKSKEDVVKIVDLIEQLKEVEE